MKRNILILLSTMVFTGCATSADIDVSGSQDQNLLTCDSVVYKLESGQTDVNAFVNPELDILVEYTHDNLTLRGPGDLCNAKALSDLSSCISMAEKIMAPTVAAADFTPAELQELLLFLNKGFVERSGAAFFCDGSISYKANANSCIETNSCGGHAPGGCACDDHCFWFGDCCFDVSSC